MGTHGKGRGVYVRHYLGPPAQGALYILHLFLYRPLWRYITKWKRRRPSHSDGSWEARPLAGQQQHSRESVIYRKWLFPRADLDGRFLHLGRVFSSLFAGLYRATLRCAHIVYRASLLTHTDAAARGSVPSCLLKRVLTQRFSVLLLLLLRSVAHLIHTMNR